MTKLHPKVQEFKQFIQQHPELIRHVRENKESWQPYFDRWMYYGEDDPYWDRFKEKPGTRGKSQGKQEGLQKLFNMLENMDLDKVQKNIEQISGALNNVQSIMSQFQKQKGHSPFSQASPPFQRQRPFPPFQRQERPENPFFYGND